MREIEEFVAHHAVRHPELLRQVHWPQVRAIAQREGVRIRRLPLSRPGRLVRYGRTWEIQLNEDLTETQLAVVGSHELVHFWRDRDEEPAIYAGEDWEPDSKEDFANLVAWYLTTPHRPPRAESSEGSS
jgi:hypothetical protein